MEAMPKASLPQNSTSKRQWIWARDENGISHHVSESNGNGNAMCTTEKDLWTPLNPKIAPLWRSLYCKRKETAAGNIFSRKRTWFNFSPIQISCYFFSLPLSAVDSSGLEAISSPSKTQLMSNFAWPLFGKEHFGSIVSPEKKNGK